MQAIKKEINDIKSDLKEIKQTLAAVNETLVALLKKDEKEAERFKCDLCPSSAKANYLGYKAGFRLFQYWSGTGLFQYWK